MKALILMSRIPIQGKTKTRLMTNLTPLQCADIHKCFLKDIYKSLRFLQGKVDLYLAHTIDGDINILKGITPEYIQLFPQSGKSLGDRMENSIKYILDKGYTKVILIGCDIPHINPRDIEDAFNILNENNMVIAPTYDGGYYLVGMDKLYSRVFHCDLPWGEDTVFEKTINIVENLGIKIGKGKTYRDIDTVEDLKAFYNIFNNKSSEYEFYPENTIGFIKEIGVI